MLEQRHDGGITRQPLELPNLFSYFFMVLFRLFGTQLIFFQILRRTLTLPLQTNLT